MSRIPAILSCGLLTAVFISHALADESFRIWVDVSGQFAVKAELVQVNADSQILRRNRLNLLHRISATCLSVADLTKVEG